MNLQDVLTKIDTALPGLNHTAHLVLATVATTRLSRQHPLAVILVGGPSSGKTSLLMPLTRGKKDSQLASNVFRIDEFTPASLVSHSSARSDEQLKKIDLLPKLDGQCVIVKEMAPLFTGKEEDLQKRFGILASVLDGEGYVSSSGNHGQRGYEEPIVFTLIGAVTQAVMLKRVYDSLSAVGPRFCFWVMPERYLTPRNWKGPSLNRNALEKDAQEAIQSFIEELFSEYASGSIEQGEFQISDSDKDKLSAIAFLMAAARSRIIMERDDANKPFEVSGVAESPERAYRYLEQVAMGAAILERRRTFANEDFKLCLGLAIGSAQLSRRRILEVFMASEDNRTTNDLAVHLRIDHETASNYAALFERFKIVEKVNSSGTTEWNLAEPFFALRRELLSPPSTNFENFDLKSI